MEATTRILTADVTQIHQMGFTCLRCGAEAREVHRCTSSLEDVASSGPKFSSVITISAYVDFGLCDAHRHESLQARFEASGPVNDRLVAAITAANRSLTNNES